MNNYVTEVLRMHAMSEVANPEHGRVMWSPMKSLWFFGHLLVALIGGLLTFDKSAVRRTHPSANVLDTL
jgi:hypothetical protein